MRNALLGILLALTCTGCFPRSQIGWFDAHAFYPTRQHYRIRYADGMEEQRTLLGPRWHVENFLRDSQGRPDRARAGWSDVRFHTVDRNGDGLADRAVRDHRFDLAFESLDENAFAWVRTDPIDAITAQRPLSVVTDSIVSGFATNEYQAGWMRGGPRLTPRVVEHGPARFGVGVEAYRVVFEVVDADRAHEGPGAVVYLVITRPSRPWSADGSPDARDGAQRVIFGLVSRPESFPMHAQELDGMLQRVDFR